MEVKLTSSCALASLVIRSHYLPSHRHATSNLRLLIASTIASSFSSISIARLQRWLDFASADEAKAFVEGVNGWQVSGDNVAIEGNGDNDVKSSVIKEHVELKREYRFFPYLARQLVLLTRFLLFLQN